MQHDRAGLAAPAIQLSIEQNQHTGIMPTSALTDTGPIECFLSPEIGRKISGCQQHSASAASADNQRGWHKIGAGCPCGGDQLSPQLRGSLEGLFCKDSTGAVDSTGVAGYTGLVQVAGFSAASWQFQVLCTQTSSTGNAFFRTA